jgi:hypothetical protein
MGNGYEVSIPNSLKVDGRIIGGITAKETFYTAPVTRTAFTYTHVLSSSDIGKPFDVLLQEGGWKRFYKMAKIVSINHDPTETIFELEEIDESTREALLEKIGLSSAHA